MPRVDGVCREQDDAVEARAHEDNAIRTQASRYAFVGGFDGTSNVLAGKIFRDLPVSGTHGHSYVQAHRSREDLPSDCILNGVDIAEAALQWRGELGYEEGAALHEGEFAAFVSYALANPTTFVALVDTYSVLDTGLRNFVTVALALAEAGFEAKGVRIDSGDLAYLSKEARQLFDRTADELDAGTYGAGRGSLAESLRKCYVVASNDINERVLLSLRDQGAKVDAYGIGTHLVTCQAQPALGCVYKLVEISGEPCLKLSQEPGKTTIPGAKACYRLVGARGQMLLDLLVPAAHAAPEVGERVLCRHPFDSSKRAYVTPSRVLELHAPVFEGGRRVGASENLRELRAYCQRQLGEVREDVLRPLNPTPYKTSVSAELFSFLQDALQRHQPITELT